MDTIFDTVLLVALPGSGKSEVRKYFDSLDPAECRRVFHMGPTVQLDDYPYVEFMRDVDVALTTRLNGDPLFYRDPQHPFQDPYEWGTLIELLNDDYDDLMNLRLNTPTSAALYLFDRIDRAELRAGARMKLGRLPDDVRRKLAEQVRHKAQKLLDAKHAAYPKRLDGCTTVLEFSRGVPAESAMPPDPPRGYGWSLSRLAPVILDNAVVLYIWVTPEESRRKNFSRIPPPGNHDTGVFHVVPLSVMMGEYGADDFNWWTSGEENGLMRILAHGDAYTMPFARMDNREDMTTCLRGKPEEWPAEQVARLRFSLMEATNRLAAIKFGG